MKYDEKCIYGFKTQEVQGLLTHKVKAHCITNNVKMSANTSTNFLLYTIIIHYYPLTLKVTIIYPKIGFYVSSCCYVMHLYDVSKTIFI